MFLDGHDVHVDKRAFYFSVHERFVYITVCMILLNCQTKGKDS